MRELIARFDVTAFDASTVPGVEGGWAAASLLRKTFTEGILGESVVYFLYSGDEANRGYLAAEHITAAMPGGEPGTVTVHHWGTQFGEESTWGGVIITGTGTGPFAGWSGAAPIEHDERGPFFRFTLD
ncbi:DUF3224 domain-containing protein [Naasia aerilata]|uniref:DUF3224 domain-containing protein n=1 Tax=Naasia aerilata TaxID=1162966 RepID=A0ABN6XJR0_9MICO|nr:DUF3224 domain-containing protein [Naasia aerilata]BDZ44343.1 hypothetical protein GCM10025866_02520 [Naasia aerilata]